MFYDHPALYDALLPVSENHLRFYGGLARAAEGGVLELACGTGQLCVPLARQRPGVCGLDLAPEMLAAARERASACGAQLELFEGDMRRFRLERPFALIFIARNSLLHLSSAQDFAELFATVRAQLAPGGVFAFDIFRPDVGLLARPAGQRFPVMSVAHAQLGQLRVECTNDYDAALQVNRATWFVSSDRGASWQFPLHLRSIFPQELPLLLQLHGFRLLSRAGDLNGGPFTAQSGLQVCQCVMA